MKLHARILFGYVTIHFVHGGLSENDDFVAMLQGSFGVKQQGEDTITITMGTRQCPIWTQCHVWKRWSWLMCAREN